jgi:tetratricopeptide (TPR) repeat protein
LNAQILPLYQEAVRINPEYWTGWSNVASTLVPLGDEESAVRASLQMMMLAGGRPGKAQEQDYGVYDLLVYNLQAYRTALLAEIAATGGISAIWAEEGLLAALADAQLHEVDTARMRLATTSWDPNSHFDAMAIANTQALIAEELGDLRAAAKSWDDFAAVWSDSRIAYNSPWAMCWAAPTYEKTGQPAKADAALAAPQQVVGISTYVDCYRFRGDVLELRGDWAAAQQWYAKAVTLAPSLPAGYYSWGLALAKHGDLAGAAEKLKLANQKGPHWADPLKVWGDVLMKQNNAKEALIKYHEALKYAPNWKQLKEAHEAAAKLTT